MRFSEILDSGMLPFQSRKKDLAFLLLLLTVLVLFSVHLFQFTVFEGYATLANDSFSYLRQAKLWSPYSEAGDYVINTLPEHSRAPGWSWVLAVSGGAESTYRAHLVVSILMLLSIAVGGWMAFRAAGLTAGIVLAITFCLLPGALISSLGILSENFYLLVSMSTLLVLGLIAQRPISSFKTSLGLNLALFGCLLLAILTRTVGIALAVAMLLSAFGNSDLNRTSRASLVIVGLLGLTAWMTWGLFGASSQLPSEHNYFVSIFSGDGRSLTEGLSILWSSFLTNLASLVNSWNHYLTLTHRNPLFFVSSYLVLALVMVFTVVRAVQFKTDALYVVAYLVIILLWPFPQEMLRFLHLVVMLLLLQPFFFLSERSFEITDRRIRIVTGIFVLALVTGGVTSQYQFLKLRHSAEIDYPGILHSFEYYDSLNRAEAIRLPMIWQSTLFQMKESATVIPPGKTVAAIKHESFMLLAGRRAVMLTSLVPYHQQVCNFLLQDVDFVFLSLINSAYVPQPYELVEKYLKITEYVQTLQNGADRPQAYVLKLDKRALETELSEAGFACQAVMFQ